MSPGRFFHYQHHLKKWIPTPNSFRLEFNDQLLEWQILVSVRSESHLACSLQQFTEGGITLEPGPEHHHVGKETDHTGNLRPDAVSHGASHRDFLLPGVAGQLHLEQS